MWGLAASGAELTAGFVRGAGWPLNPPLVSEITFEIAGIAYRHFKELAGCITGISSHRRMKPKPQDFVYREIPIYRT